MEKNYTAEYVTQSFRNALREYYGTLLDTEGQAEPVKYVDTSAILNNIAGVADFKHLRLNGKVANVILSEDEFPYTGEITAVIYDD